LNILNPSFRILNNFFNNRDQNLKLLISRHLNENPDISRNEVTRIVYGIVRKEKLIEFIASKFINRKLSGMDKKTQLFLYIGIYMIYYSGSYPDYAVVNEIVGKAPARSKGFLNAVLRRIGRESEKIDDLIAGIEDPVIKYSVSKEICKNLELLTNSINDYLDYFESEPVFHVRVNHPEPDFNAAGSALREKKISCRYISKIGSFEISDAGKMVREIIPGHGFYFQNSGSFAVSLTVSSFRGKKILDGCAAPGTKSISISLLRPEAEIVSLDINPERIKLITPFLDNSGKKNIFPESGDIVFYPDKEDFDIILIDAPCTSSGTLRKNPDLKIKVTKQNIERNSAKQKQILRSVLSAAKKGAIIIYAVCSFIYDESEGVLNDSIGGSESKNFEVIDINNFLSDYGFNTRSGEFGIYLLPDREMNNDLFYITAIRKK